MWKVEKRQTEATSSIMRWVYILNLNAIFSETTNVGMEDSCGGLMWSDLNGERWSFFLCVEERWWREELRGRQERQSLQNRKTKRKSKQNNQVWKGQVLKVKKHIKHKLRQKLKQKHVHTCAHMHSSTTHMLKYARVHAWGVGKLDEEGWRKRNFGGERHRSRMRKEGESMSKRPLWMEKKDILMLSLCCLQSGPPNPVLANWFIARPCHLCLYLLNEIGT